MFIKQMRGRGDQSKMHSVFQKLLWEEGADIFCHALRCTPFPHFRLLSSAISLPCP